MNTSAIPLSTMIARHGHIGFARQVQSLETEIDALKRDNTELRALISKMNVIFFRHTNFVKRG